MIRTITFEENSDMCAFGGGGVPQVIAPVMAPPVAAPAAPVAPPQPPQQPDQAALRTTRAGTGQRAPGAAVGASSTMLTGVGGVDPRLLSIGKNTLLGAS